MDLANLEKLVAAVDAFSKSERLEEITRRFSAETDGNKCYENNGNDRSTEKKSNDLTEKAAYRNPNIANIIPVSSSNGGVKVSRGSDEARPVLSQVAAKSRSRVHASEDQNSEILATASATARRRIPTTHVALRESTINSRRVGARVEAEEEGFSSEDSCDSDGEWLPPVLDRERDNMGRFLGVGDRDMRRRRDEDSMEDVLGRESIREKKARLKPRTSAKENKTSIHFEHIGFDEEMLKRHLDNDRRETKMREEEKVWQSVMEKYKHLVQEHGGVIAGRVCGGSSIEKRYLSNSSQVTIYVGPRRTSWTLNKNLICDQVEFFQNAFSSLFGQIPPSALELPADDPKDFSKVVDWLYTQRLAACEFCEKFEPVFRQPSVRFEPEHELQWCSLWMFADKLGMNELAKAALNRLRACSLLSKLCISAEAIAFVSENMPKTYVLRATFLEIALRNFFAGGPTRRFSGLGKSASVSKDFNDLLMEKIRDHILTTASHCLYMDCIQHTKAQKASAAQPTEKHSEDPVLSLATTPVVKLPPPMTSNPIPTPLSLLSLSNPFSQSGPRGYECD